MPYYEVLGKWYHREYSDYFKHVIKAQSPRAALLRFARCASDVEHASEITWEGDSPKAVAVGRQEPEPTFWVGDDQMYKVRYVSQVRPQIVECPRCHGRGKINGFVPIDDAPGTG